MEVNEHYYKELSFFIVTAVKTSNLTTFIVVAIEENGLIKGCTFLYTRLITFKRGG
jgi:hypothetical protein